MYGAVVTAGIHRARIKVAEAAKVIENTLRDINIALMNELALIFNRLGIDTLEVLEAAGSKWNFLPFRPGLRVGIALALTLLPDLQGRRNLAAIQRSFWLVAVSTTAWASMWPKCALSA